jgi:hypothetical protein
VEVGVGAGGALRDGMSIGCLVPVKGIPPLSPPPPPPPPLLLLLLPGTLFEYPDGPLGD